jgi:hypothetical protein
MQPPKAASARPWSDWLAQAEVEDAHDVRVVQLGGLLRLSLEARQGRLVLQAGRRQEDSNGAGHVQREVDSLQTAPIPPAPMQATDRQRPMVWPTRSY